ncbi:MAG TPA: AAA family ATPase [Verrucomicrobiae bacterium]|nr:AAA family ATPase [Verrucomicrobiae bacterium]
MATAQPTIYLIAGCNGAGKTTFAKSFLPNEAKCLNFLNADLIAQGLSPLNTRAAAIKAGRLLTEEFRSFVAKRETFAFESTLSGKTYIGLLKNARQRGFRIYLHYLWLPTPALAVARVRERVKKGGHDVPEADVRRRFARSLQHFMHDYILLVDRWAAWDNQTSPPHLLAESGTCTTSELKVKLGMS